MAALQTLAVRYTDCVPVLDTQLMPATLLNTQSSDPHKDEEKCFS